ncbi:protein of unknown function (DUF3598) [Synechococcus sp. PCC 7502]|uniref:DUF3598 family protein n=1 Tax=Synechococcus sp. PCC 7502 TaxID=1173263 RepID=UPI00029FFA70|nr:DUF3598 family protein [Synechococcus sp. PCC 7502]AFY74632.1 protein of unknown function (DUF3598) [Synechococcus sp. PCC 7502]
MTLSTTLSQWDCLLKNLGCWQGSFTRISPNGEFIEDIPSETILAGGNENKAIRQTIRQFYPSGTQERNLEYSSLARSVLFFSNGAFSQGSIQLGFNSEFGAELGLIYGNSRRRLVQLFNQKGELDRLTYIRENLEAKEPTLSQDISWEKLQGKWQCEVLTLYPDWRSPDQFTTETRWENQTRISTIGNKLEGNIKVLFLPDGVASVCPTQTKLRRPVTLEVLWLVKPNIYHQMIRHYDERGGWVSLTLAIASRILP